MDDGTAQVLSAAIGSVTTMTVAYLTYRLGIRRDRNADEEE